MKTKTINGVIIKLGETAKENWELIDNSNKKHIWIHLKSFPSGHVIIEDELPNTTLLLEAANFCKENTKYRYLQNLKVNITQCSNLKKGKNIGEVFFIKNKHVRELSL